MRISFIVLLTIFAHSGLWLTPNNANSAGIDDWIRVTIPTPNHSVSSLQGYMKQPSKSNGAAIILLHGCGGVGSRPDTVNARHTAMAEMLQNAGYVVLLVDSFASRGINEVCTVKMSDRSIRPKDRVADVYAALDWLQQQSNIDATRIGLLGWSHGGSTTLLTLEKNRDSSSSRFRAAVAFYPGCTTLARHPERYQPYAPLQVFIGEADDWTPAKPCIALIESIKKQGANANIRTYAGAYHDFDNPKGRERVRKEVPNGVNPGKGVTVGPNPEAREDAWKRTKDFFAEYLK